jgi:hypothetical protein
MKTFIVLLMGIAYLICGIICIKWPNKIQEYSLKWSEKGISKFNPFLEWMKTRSYIISLKIIGMLAILAFFLLLYVMLVGKS